MTHAEAAMLNKEQALENGNNLAFPVLSNNGTLFYGLTKREYIATQIMAGLIANGTGKEDAASRAVNAADILLIQLKGIN